jgi:hypothetical protein
MFFNISWNPKKNSFEKIKGSSRKSRILRNLNFQEKTHEFIDSLVKIICEE